MTHFELVCRRVLAESRRDSDANLARTRSTPVVHAGGLSPIRLVTGLTLSRAALAPNAVGAIGDWTSEYAVGSAVAAALAEASATGYALVPLPKGAPGSTPRPRLADRQRPDPAAGDHRRVGRADLQPATRGGRTPAAPRMPGLRRGVAQRSRRREPHRRAVGWHGWPAWVVSRRVVEVLRRSQVRGWHYRPVLIRERPLYGQYLADWQLLAVAVAGTTRSQFEGGRW